MELRNEIAINNTVEKMVNEYYKSLETNKEVKASKMTKDQIIDMINNIDKEESNKGVKSYKDFKKRIVSKNKWQYNQITGNFYKLKSCNKSQLVNILELYIDESNKVYIEKEKEVFDYRIDIF